MPSTLVKKKRKTRTGCSPGSPPTAADDVARTAEPDLRPSLPHGGYRTDDQHPAPLHSPPTPTRNPASAAALRFRGESKVKRHVDRSRRSGRGRGRARRRKVSERPGRKDGFAVDRERETDRRRTIDRHDWFRDIALC